MFAGPAGGRSASEEGGYDPMKKRLRIYLGALAVAAFALACGESDPAITTKVKTRISTDRSITTASDIHVSTQGKVVTLTGSAESPQAKERAVALARGTEGVVDVVDNLTLSPAVATAAGNGLGEKISEQGEKIGEAIDDATITTAVKAKLLADGQVPGTKIDVDTKAGVVTLSGTVKNEQEKEKAIQIARETRGVQRVEVQLMVRSS
jgi:osmotically-inducible protein OsmY